MIQNKNFILVSSISTLTTAFDIFLLDSIVIAIDLNF